MLKPNISLTNHLLTLKEKDFEIFKVISKESERQKDHLELIASENYASLAVMQAQGSVLTNKYAEGYPGRRYYGGCEFVDTVEELAQKRVGELYGAKYANVQPHSGSAANMAVLMSVLKPGDVLLGMGLQKGGHLTHGAPFSFSGSLYKSTCYGVNKEGFIDYDEVLSKAKSEKPKLIIAGFSAYSRVVDWKKFRSIADEVGAYLLVDMAHVAGLVAAGVYPNPMPYAHFVTSTTHKTLRGPRGGFILTNDSKLYQKINSAVFPMIQGGPLMHVIAAKAVAFLEAKGQEFKDYQNKVIKNAKALGDALIQGGLSLVTGGTDNHMLLVDLLPISVTGKEAQEWLHRAHITTNKNLLPFDKTSPHITSGVRLGTPALTTRNMGEEEMKKIAHWILEVLKSKGSEASIQSVQKEVKSLCIQFPI